MELLCRIVLAVALAATGGAWAQSEPTPVTSGEHHWAGQEAVKANDYPAAVRWWTRGVELGSRDAARDLGLLFARGAPGVPQDSAKAREWLARAAQMGDAQSATLLRELPSQPAAQPAPVRPVQTSAPSVSPSGSQAMPIVGGSGGELRTLACGARERMVGARFHGGDWIEGVQIMCAPYDEMSRGAPRWGASAGKGTEPSVEAYCGRADPHAWVMSLGAVAIENVTPPGAPQAQTLIARANLWCLTPKGWPLGVGPTSLQAKAQYQQTGKLQSACPKDTPAVGLQVRVGAGIHAMGVLCEGKALDTALHKAHMDFDEAKLAAQRGDHDKAIALYSSALSSGKMSREDRAAAHNNRGVSWAKKGDHARSMADHQAASQLDPTIGAPPRASQSQSYGGNSGSGGGGKSMADQISETQRRQQQERCQAWLNNPNRGKFANPCS